MEIKIIHINIEGNKHESKVSKLINDQNPYIICLCEIRESFAKNLAKEFKYNYIYSPLVSVDNETQGSAILTKYKIIEDSSSRYDKSDLDSLPTLKSSQNGNRPNDRFMYHYSVLTARLKIGFWKKINIATTHFPVTDHSTPGYPEHVFDELSDVMEVVETRNIFDRFMAIIKNLPSPLLFTADLNNPRGEYMYDKLAHYLIDIVPKNIKSTLDSNLHRAHGLELVVDAVMVSPDLFSKVKSVKMIDGVSDHQAIITILKV